MEFNNKTILIGGLVILSLVAMYFNYKDIALAIASGLVGYLSKDVVSVDQLTEPVDQPVENSSEPVDASSETSSDESPEEIA